MSIERRATLHLSTHGLVRFFLRLGCRCNLPLCAGTSYVLNAVDWIFGIFIVFGVVTTGLSADAGHRWAAGNRAYRPIPDEA